MKTTLFTLFLLAQTAFSQFPGPESKAYVLQYLVTPEGDITVTETTLNEKTGNFTSIPLEGLLALFELWVYPLIGEDGGAPIAELKDSDTVGVLPNFDLTFDGVDPHQHPRTRSDWEHKITLKIHEPVGELEDGQVAPEWMQRFLLRKRYLAAEHIGKDDTDSHWVEVDSLPIHHTTANQVMSFTDDALPPESTADTDADNWAGIIEYQVVADSWEGSPIAYLQLTTMQIRVWPRWNAEFLNFPAEPVAKIPSNLEASVTDIYPGTEKVVVEYLYDPKSSENFDGITPIEFTSELWTASVSQDRTFPLSAIYDLEDSGKYKVRVACHYPWGVEYSDDLIDADAGGTIADDDEDDEIIVTSGSTVIRGSIHSLR